MEWIVSGAWGEQEGSDLTVSPLREDGSDGSAVFLLALFEQMYVCTVMETINVKRERARKGGAKKSGGVA